MDIEKKLTELNLKRDKSGVGKKVGNDYYFHNLYLPLFVDERKMNLFFKVANKHPELMNFEFNIIRYNEKENNISFIECKNFDVSEEPIVGDSLKFDFNTKKFTKTKQPKNPLIYHHKWMFVDDTYKGFDVEESKKRSIKWKSVLGVNKEISSKIGRLNFWLEWLQKNNIKSMNSNNQDIQEQLKNIKEKNQLAKCWQPYYDNSKINQEITSAATSRSQLPRTAKFLKHFNLQDKGTTLLDIGCGHKNEKFIDFLNDLGINYYGCDLFNQPMEVNDHAIQHCKNGQADLITINNVFNTIENDQNIIDILEQAKNSLNEKHGILNILTYEGEKNKNDIEKEKELGKKLSLEPIKTRDGYQRRQKTDTYLPLVKKVFPNCKMVSHNGTKVIVAASNLNLDLSNEFQQKKKKNKIRN
tara:strand:- start:26853 stop:28094 length:1242 start_codon:yes stop_codon:yes gene_type:complete